MGGGGQTGLHIAIVNNDKLSQTYKNSHFFKRTLKKNIEGSLHQKKYKGKEHFILYVFNKKQAKLK